VRVISGRRQPNFAATAAELPLSYQTG